MHIFWYFADGRLSTRISTKGDAHCSFCRVLRNSYFGKASLINFVSTWNKVLKHCIFVDFFSDRWLSTRHSTKGAVHCSFSRTLSKCYFGKALLINFISTWKNSLKHCIFADFLLIVSYIQGFLWKELLIAPFVEHFRMTNLRKFHWRLLLLFLLIVNYVQIAPRK